MLLRFMILNCYYVVVIKKGHFNCVAYYNIEI